MTLPEPGIDLAASGWENPDHHAPTLDRSAHMRPELERPAAPGPDPDPTELAGDVMEIYVRTWDALWELTDRLEIEPAPASVTRDELRKILEGESA